MGTYRKNADGLICHDGTRATEHLARKVGGQTTKITMNLLYEDVVTDPAATDALKAQYMRGTVIPSGALITSAKLFVTEVWTGSSSTLSIGTYNADTGAAVDADGIDATIALSGVLDTAGEVITCDGAQVVSASGGTALTAASVIAASWGTAVFTAGAARLELEYIIPINA